MAAEAGEGVHDIGISTLGLLPAFRSTLGVSHLLLSSRIEKNNQASFSREAVSSDAIQDVRYE